MNFNLTTTKTLVSLSMPIWIAIYFNIILKHCVGIYCYSNPIIILGIPLLLIVYLIWSLFEK
ncbi:MAG: hypothetical protein Q7S33_00255 [Nanoarchaeota archaeon]|nr:hypothetical protein [Nanoarchaeota archaeon]